MGNRGNPAKITAKSQPNGRVHFLCCILLGSVGIIKKVASSEKAERERARKRETAVEFMLIKCKVANWGRCDGLDTEDNF